MSYRGGQLVYNQFTVKTTGGGLGTGDILNGPTGSAMAPVQFASGPTIPANSLPAGTVLTIDIPIKYTSPLVNIPSTYVMVTFGGKVVWTSPALSNLTGTGGQAILARVYLTVTSPGSSGSVSTYGWLMYGISNALAVTLPVAPAATVAVDMTGPNVLAAGVYVTGAGNNFTLGPGMAVNQQQPVAASN